MRIPTNVITISFMGVLWTSASFGQAVSGQNYRIFSACDLTKVMAVAGDSSSSLLDKAAIVLQTKVDSKTSQIFKFESTSLGYKITAQNSGKLFNIVNASTAANARLEQYKAISGSTSEAFKLSSTSDGYTRIQNVNSGLYLNLMKASTVENNPFEQYLDSTACAEKFKLVAVASAPTPTPTPISTPTPTPTPISTPTPTPSPVPTTGVRDPLKQPFATTSIWNMPIGSGAQFVAANFLENSNPGGSNIWAPFPGMDQENIVQTPTAPLTPVYFSSAGWSGANRCTISGSPRMSVPMPSSYVVPSGTGNNSTAFLLADKRTVIQMQPLARCTAGGPATSYAFFNPVDLYGDGREGSHGGSRLSGLGGSLRLGELRPGQQGPRHALKLTVYAKAALYRCSVSSDCYRWPAFNADSYAVGTYGTANNNSNVNMKMGTLLAIPGSVNIANLGLETEPGRQLAWTLQNYGAYIVDDGAVQGMLFSTENGAAGNKATEFQNDYGYAFLQRVTAPNAWLRDVQRLAKALAAVANNSPTSIGGGGTPRQPLAAPIAP